MNPIKKMLEPIAFVIDLLGFLNIHLSVKLESRMKYAQPNYYLKQLEGINSLLCVEISKGFILIWTLDFFLVEISITKIGWNIFLLLTSHTENGKKNSRNSTIEMMLNWFNRPQNYNSIFCVVLRNHKLVLCQIKMWIKKYIV